MCVCVCVCVASVSVSVCFFALAFSERIHSDNNMFLKRSPKLKDTYRVLIVFA